MIVIPMPAMDCKTDWDYNLHGANWQCRCKEGFEQSPIDLPARSCSEIIAENAEFEYNFVSKKDLEFIYDINLLRIKPKPGINMGKITDTDMTIYQVTEILIHTPSEHTIIGKRYPMEV